MPYCIPCKIIIDNGNALIQAVSCMQASVTLGAIDGRTPPDSLVKEFLDKANELASLSQKIAKHYDAGSSKSGG